MEKVLADGHEWQRVFSRIVISHMRVAQKREIIDKCTGPAQVAAPGDFVLFTTGPSEQRVMTPFMAQRIYSNIPFPDAAHGDIMFSAPEDNQGWAFEKLAAHLYATGRKVRTLTVGKDELGTVLHVTFEQDE